MKNAVCANPRKPVCMGVGQQILQHFAWKAKAQFNCWSGERRRLASRSFENCDDSHGTIGLPPDSRAQLKILDKPIDPIFAPRPGFREMIAMDLKDGITDGDLPFANRSLNDPFDELAFRSPGPFRNSLAKRAQLAPSDCF